jgi:Zn-dependent peptidase ImmA (M78 family)
MPGENNPGSLEASCGFPAPPEVIADWARHDAKAWQRLDDFDVLTKAEGVTGLRLEIKYESLPEGVWGIHLVRGDRGRIFINSALPLVWRRFALFHELYHLICHRKGARFWTHTFESMESFENRADMFAWAALWPEWTEGDYSDWSE